MKPDTSGPTPIVDHREPAHLHAPDDRSPIVWRYDPSPALAELIGRHWIPAWSLPAGAVSTQRILQYPVALVVIDAHDARFSGVASGLSTVELTGTGWAVGAMLRPGAGTLLTGGSMAEWTDRTEPLSTVLRGADDLASRVRRAIADDPDDDDRRRAAVVEVEAALAPYLPLDDEGALVNEVVRLAEEDRSVTRVSDLCKRLEIGERTLQRLARRRLGISPRWLIARRRLHEATDALRRRDETIAAVAARLGYADQAHLTRDLRAVTDLTPAAFAATYGSAG